MASQSPDCTLHTSLGGFTPGLITLGYFFTQLVLALLASWLASYVHASASMRN
jgi:hypothetical protein